MSAVEAVRPVLLSTRLLRSELGMVFRRRRNQAILAVLAAIPSVAYGFFALVVLAPLLQNDGGRVLAWLRQGDLASAPSMRGMWGEAADRARRLLRQQQQLVAASDARLQAILAALQATPNGVLLMDGEGHIEWCNQQAAQHFGLDVQRDRMQSVSNLLRDPAFSAYLAARDYTHDVLLAGRESTPKHHVRLSVQLYPYGDGRRLMLSRDVTQLEQAEAMLTLDERFDLASRGRPRGLAGAGDFAGFAPAAGLRSVSGIHPGRADLSFLPPPAGFPTPPPSSKPSLSAPASSPSPWRPALFCTTHAPAGCSPWRPR